MSKDGARTLVESAFAAMKRDILSGALKPGEKLRTHDLHAAYGLGASTIREALTRLGARVIDKSGGAG